MNILYPAQNKDILVFSLTLSNKFWLSHYWLEKPHCNRRKKMVFIGWLIWASITWYKCETHKWSKWQLWARESDREYKTNMDARGIKRVTSTGNNFNYETNLIPCYRIGE